MHRIVERYVWAVAILGLAMATGWTVVGATRPVVPATLAVLSVLALVAALVPVRFRHHEGVQGFTLESGVFVACLLLLPVGIVPLVHTCCSVVAHGVRSRDVRKSVFNAGRTAIESTIGAVAFFLISGGGAGGLGLRPIAAALVAAVSFEAVSFVAMRELFRRLEGRPRTARFSADVGRLALLTLLGNSAFGITLATVASVSAPIAGVSGILMLGLYAGYRGYAAAIDARRRSEALSQMTHLLLRRSSAGTPIDEFLVQLLRTLGGTAADLILVSGHGCLRWRATDEDVAVTAMQELPSDGLLGQALRRDECLVVQSSEDLPFGLQEAVVAPIGLHGQAAGVIAIYGRRGVEGWTRSDASLLGAIANELAVALENDRLFDQVEQDRKHLESETRKLGDILGAASDGITLIHSSAVIESWNPAMERITQVSAAEAVGQPWYLVLRLRDHDGVELLPNGAHVLTRAFGGESSDLQVSLQILRRDGDWHWLQCTAAPVVGQSGIDGIVLVARNVTGEREVEELKADFIATVSHELRTPLTPLKGFLSTIQQRADTMRPEQLRAVHEAMTTQVSRLETLISDLLAVAELEHGRFEVRPEPVDLAHLVAAAVEVECDAQGELQGASRRCQVVVLRPVAAMADTVALVRVVRALVSNALKHTTGAVEVVVDAEGDWASVHVRDQGPGIPAHDQPRIFERFGRLGDHLRRTQGPGLGLTIARALAGRMGGGIALQSDVETGSEFTLTLPRARPRALPVEIGTPAATRRATAAG